MSGLHALIIDDDATSIHILEKLLDREGISCTAIIDATRTEEVLSTLEQLDIVFLDLEMPKLDGYEVFEILKPMLDPSIPIVACTIYTNEVNQTRRLGFSSFIAKPVDMDRFPAQLDSILQGVPIWELR